MKQLLLILTILLTLPLFSQENKPTPHEQALTSLSEGMEKASSGKWTDAINDYNNAIALDPKNADAYYNRALARFNLQDYRGALMDHSRAISIGTSTGADCVSAAYYGRGQCFYQLGQKDKACLDFIKSNDMGNADGANAMQNYCN
jgi:tetratricopeptide (TPR) repeat protein